MMTFALSDNPFEAALFIRRFEEALLDLHKQGMIAGTVHTYVGQESIAIALRPHLRPGRDAFFATHRGHGHYLAQGGSPEALLAEIMGREGALCAGRGGSQHLCDNNFFSNGIQGAGVVQAVGYAWSQKLRGENSIVVAQLGDGTLGQGAVYEAMNFAALLSAPVLFLIEYNGWAQSTDVRNTTAGTIEARAAAFAVEYNRCDDLDFVALRARLGSVVETVRGGRPYVQIIDTRRLLAHSKGDDDRPAELIQRQYAVDPVKIWLKRNLPEAEIAEARVGQQLERQISEVSARPEIRDLGGPAVPDLAEVITSDELQASLNKRNTYNAIVQELNKALHHLLGENERVIVLGEDIADPYGGAFKVTRGITTAFSSRTFSTPIAENAIVGFATGAALAGLRPIVEMMFADFVTLAADQLINSAAKFHYMFGGKVRCPITVRLVSGGGRGYGPTHSQSPERLFCGEPGLRVIALSRRHDPAALLNFAVQEDDAPTVFVEDKSLYPHQPLTEAPIGLGYTIVPGTRQTYPPLMYIPTDGSAKVTVVCYGAALQIAEEALEELLLTHEIGGELIVLTQLSPLDATLIIESVARTRHLLIVEPHVDSYGVGAAVSRCVSEALDGAYRLRTVGAKSYPIPAARALEDQVLPTVTDAFRSLLQLLRL
jgi:2-oxoisovalerate dehydrogenase E1 component